MKPDVLTIIRTKLLANSAITAIVGSNIGVRKRPIAKANAQITMRKTFGVSNSILPATRHDIFIDIWVLQKSVTEPYKTTTTLVEKILDVLNRMGESLNSENRVVNQIVKTDAEIDYTEDNEYWHGMINFECVTNE